MGLVPDSLSPPPRGPCTRLRAKLRASFAGTVTSLNTTIGETVMPGRSVLTLAHLDQLPVQTTNLSERDVAPVAVRKQARAYVEALDLEIASRVTEIAPRTNTVGGDVVYDVLIALDKQPPGLRWGMSVEVAIDGS